MIETDKYSKWFVGVVTEKNPKGESVMERLYNRMEGAYLHKWRSNFPSAESVDNWMASWAEAFEDKGITLLEIKDGIAWCQQNSGGGWPPTCAEFIAICRPQKKIDPLTAYYEAVAGCQERSRGEIGTWSHPAIFWAAVSLSYDLLSQTYSQIKARWEVAFNAQMAKTEWEEITKPVMALPAPSKTRQDNQAAAQVLNQLGAGDALKPKRSDTEWYRKILERVKNGDKTVSRISRKFAEEAALAHGYKY